MTRLVCAAIAVAMVASLLFPVAPFGGAVGASSAVSLESPAELIPLTAVEFPEPIDTSAVVPEYTMVSRALMLPGGSSDVALEDLNDDGLTDLVVSVYEALTISIFYRQLDGTFSTYPSFNITTLYNPMSIETADIYSSGDHQIVALEKNSAFSDTRLAVYNLTSPSTFERWPDQRTYAGGVEFVVGEFSGDVFSDLAVVCEGTSPETLPGRVEIFFGPDFGMFELLTAGLGANTIVAGDFDDDFDSEIAVGNHYSRNVMLFERPFISGAPPTSILTVDGMPTSMSVNDFSGDMLDDLVVASDSVDALRFYYQNASGLPSNEYLNISLGFSPSFVVPGVFSGDALVDLLVLSATANVSAGFLQQSPGGIWNGTPDFILPTGGVPRGAVIANLDSDTLMDIAIASARNDWTGSSLALYPHRGPTYSNSNATAWTRSSVDSSMIDSGDLNGDGVQDLVSISPTDDTLDFALSFGAPTGTIALGFDPSQVDVSDFNMDGFADVLVVMEGGSSITVACGGIAFPSNVVQLTSGGPITDMAVGDFNHDSLQDFVVSTEDGKLDVFFNDGTVSPFASPYEVAPTGGAGIRSIAVGDFDSDGLDDLAYPIPIRKIAIILQSLTVPFGSTTPSLFLTYPEGGDFAELWGGDVTGDGKADLAAMRSFDPSVYLFDQTDFTGSHTSFGTLALPEIPAFISVMDATDDGPLDVVAIFDSADLVFLYRQSGGNISASPSMVFVAGSMPNYVTIGDGTGDRRGDLLVNCPGSHSVSVWEQINFPPIAHAGGPYLTREGRTLQLNGSSETGTSEIPFMLYRWDYGDGNFTDWINQPRPTHAYYSMGNFSIRMDAQDPAGLVSTDFTYVVVDDSTPLVAFSWEPYEVNEGYSVLFVDETDSYDPIVLRNWTVDNQSFGSSQQITSDFQNGTHYITLEVTDSDGSFASITEVLEVASVAPTLRVAAPLQGTEGSLVEFEVFVDEWHGTPVDPIVSYEWDFSYVPESFVPDPYAPNSPVASHVFATSSYWKIYRVAVRVTDSDGMQNVSTADIQIFDSEPVAGLTTNSSYIAEGVPFTFVSTSTSFDGIINWTWVLEYPNGSTESYWVDDREMADLEFTHLDDGDYSMDLTVVEPDGNTSTSSVDFVVHELPPTVSVLTEEVEDWEGYFEEYFEVSFQAPASGFDPVVLWEWDFDSPGPTFFADLVTTSGSGNHTYDQVGDYVVKVRVWDSDGSMGQASLAVEIRQKLLSCEMYRDVRVIRAAPNTEDVTFNVTALLVKFPDIIHLGFEFGDGTSVSIDGPPFGDVFHRFSLGRDYKVNLTIADDEGFTFVSMSTVYVDPPEISLIEPSNGAVVKSGTTILFLVTPGSSPLMSVTYDVNDVAFRPFETQYIVNTTGWPDAEYRLAVIAWDGGGNVAILRYVYITVDDFAPVAVVHAEKTKVYAGSEFTITVWVSDRNVEASGVILYVMFPGDRVFLQYPVSEGPDGNYYREFEAPTVEGTIQFFAEVSDLAGNSAVSPSYSISVKIPFLTIAWPYLLTASMLAAIGTVAYFARESKIAVDETYVIHNDGRMITHNARRLKPGMDDQVLSGMFTAIQDFVKESFKDITSFTLRKLEFGEKSVLIEKGEHVYLAVILHGHASRKVAARMQKMVDDIESRYGQHLKSWDGDFEKLRGINELTKRIYSKAPLLPSLPGRRS